MGGKNQWRQEADEGLKRVHQGGIVKVEQSEMKRLGKQIWLLKVVWNKMHGQTEEARDKIEA